MRLALPYVRLLGAIVVGASLSSYASEAFADEPAMVLSHYVVVTKDGSTYQGELVENIVGSHVILRLATGEIVTVDARDIQSQGSATTTPTAPVVATFPLPPPPLPPSNRRPPRVFGLPDLFSGTPRAYDGPDAVHVHITSSNDTSASLAEESASGWVTVCQIPCTTTVDPKAMFQLQTMPGLTVPSAPFRFPGDEGALELNASVTSRLHNMGWGIGMVTAGPLVALPGIFMLSGMFDSTGADGAPGSPGTAETIAGWTLIGASTAIVIAGVVMLAMPASSRLTDANGHRIAKQDGVRLTPTGLVF